MNDPILVSVMCTAFNHENYIRQALDGMVNQQTDFAYEILVTDDVSTDRTADIIREYEAKYPDKIRAFYMERNLFSQGIDIYYAVLFPNARGKYTAICEGDDYWTDPTKLQRQVDFLEAHPDYTACVHNTELLFCDGGRPSEALAACDTDRDMEFSDILPGMNNAWHTSSLLARTDLLANPPDYYEVAIAHGFSDFPYALWLRENGKVRCLARFMSVYRVNSGAAAWSAGVKGQYEKKIQFYSGAIAMLECFRAHVRDESLLRLTDKNIDRWRFDLLYLQGRDRELRQPPYRAILKTMPLKFRAINFLKCMLPGLQKLYRRRKGYEK
ncbi:MAG: glycosyltransferase family 2 protein [Oscillospiraceae bacterium]|nr:glycosyltransferase family 2 protein [Oscillospiraceae bacterium]